MDGQGSAGQQGRSKRSLLVTVRKAKACVACVRFFESMAHLVRALLLTPNYYYPARGGSDGGRRRTRELDGVLRINADLGRVVSCMG